MAIPQHFDEALDAVERVALEVSSAVSRILVVADLFGGITVVVWPIGSGVAPPTSLVDRLQGAGGSFVAGVHIVNEGDALSDIYDGAWAVGETVDGDSKLRIDVRHRTHGGWLTVPRNPAWPLTGEPPAPPIVVFYSYKGGVGRTSALAAFAINRARKNERVLIVDLDFDAPGIGTLFAPHETEAAAEYGVVDYLVERDHVEPVLENYVQRVRVPGEKGAEDLIVIPAGRVNSRYVAKLGRLDMEPPESFGEIEHREDPLTALLADARREFRPDWILLDARAGLADPAGAALSGIAHLSVLLGTSSDQTWAGLRIVLKRIGESRIRRGKPQAACVLVHTMIPPLDRIKNELLTAFAAKARIEFEEAYYLAMDTVEDHTTPDDDEYWTLRDANLSTAPHVPVPIYYDESIPFASKLEQFARLIRDSREYAALEARIVEQVGPQRPQASEEIDDG